MTFNTALIDLSSDYSEVAISTVTSIVHNNKDKKWLRKCKSDLDFALKGISWIPSGMEEGGITRKGHQCALLTIRLIWQLNSIPREQAR